MNVLREVWRDLIHAGRSLAKARAFTIVCVLSLGIGMAPVIAIPYATRIFTTAPPGLNTDGLVELTIARAGAQKASSDWSYPDFVDLRAASTGASLTGWAVGSSKVTLPASQEKTTAQTMFVSANYFSVMGVTLARGPGLPTEQTTEPVVILADTFWKKRLAADPDVVGKPLTLNGVPHVVVGVAPEPFDGHLAMHEAELFVPLESHPRFLADTRIRFERSEQWVRIHGRLLPGAGIAQASAAVAALTSQLAREFPTTNESRAGVVEPYTAPGNLESVEISILMGVWQVMTLLPLVVVCLNISGMVQVRSAMRERELSIRQAIGASRPRLIRHLLAEAVVLAALGGALASLVIFNIPGVASWWLGEPIPLHLREALRLDFSMLAITVGMCLGTSLVFGWLPAARFSRPVILTVLKDDAGGGGGIRAGRVHRLTAALQVAVAVPLLIVSGMSLDRMRATATAELGFASELLYAAPLKDDLDGFRMRTVRENLSRASGVDAVTVADGLPLDFRYRVTRVALETAADVAPKFVSAHVTRVGDDYLSTMSIPLVLGRGFTIEDRAGAEMVTVISKALADKLFPSADAGEAIGKQLNFEIPGVKETKTHTLTIVGISGDFPTSQMSTDREQLLLPMAQHPDVRRDGVPIEDDRSNAPTIMIVARSAPGEPAAKLQAALENAIREADPNFEPSSITTGASLRQYSMDDFLNASAFTGLPGGVILLLAALGIYGVVGLMVATRTREIAVRVALGASRLRVIGMILFDVIKLVGPGVLVGALLTALMVRLEGGITLSNIEPLAYVAGGAIAILTAMLSGLAPARRAASVEPMVAMRS